VLPSGLVLRPFGGPPSPATTSRLFPDVKKYHSDNCSRFFSSIVDILSNNSQVDWLIISGNHRCQQIINGLPKSNLLSQKGKAMGEKQFFDEKKLLIVFMICISACKTTARVYTSMDVLAGDKEQVQRTK
jgi:hypothetical protein